MRCLCGSDPQRGLQLSLDIAVIGAGAVGAGTAWHLGRHGYTVSLFDPSLADPAAQTRSIGALHGTGASLGVLMGHIFRRSSGRGWRLRQRSMTLWQSWIERLRVAEPSLRLITPLLQLSNDEPSLNRQRALALERQSLGLSMVQRDQLPLHARGGLLSKQDGRVDPLCLLRALHNAMAPENVRKMPAKVTALSRTGRTTTKRWRVESSETDSTVHDAVVISSALGSDALLDPLGHSRKMAPVLGQALALQLNDGPENWLGWPAVLVNHGFNLIPGEPRRMLLGATVEPGSEAASEPLNLMKQLDGAGPEWLVNASVVQRWSGLRARPVERPAPLLEELEPGLILATGHYRNGILLAPATAEWVEERLALR